MPTPEQQAAFDKFAEVMDKRDAFFQELKNFEEKQGFIPEILPNGQQVKGDIRMMNAYAEWKRCGSWRTMPGVVKKMWKTAKKARASRKQK